MLTLSAAVTATRLWTSIWYRVRRSLSTFITAEASLVSLVRGFLEDRLGRSCAYVQGSFLVYRKEVGRLLR